jgi:hypothetical protein
MADFNIAAAMAAIQQQRDAQPLRYAPGTLSLDARKAMEQKRQFNNELAENQRQFNIEAQMKAAAAARAASGGGGGGGTKFGNQYGYQDAINAMNTEHEWWLGAQNSPNKTDAPKDFSNLINEVMVMSRDQGMPMSNTEINQLQDYGEQLRNRQIDVLKAGGVKGWKGSSNPVADYLAASGALDEFR